MNRLTRIAGAMVVSLACAVASAQTPSKAGEKKNAPAAGSPEALVAARFAEKSGGQKPDQVFKGRGGLYEVLIGGQIYYVDSDVTFVLAGRMFDPTLARGFDAEAARCRAEGRFQVACRLLRR